MKGEALRLQIEVDRYVQYTSLLSAMTQIDVPKMAAAMEALITRPDLRQTMGQAAQHRAKSLYDWSVVIPQMQDFWEDLTAIRTAATKAQNDVFSGADIPVAPNPSHYFKSYPTVLGGIEDVACLRMPWANAQGLGGLLRTRGFKELKREILSEGRLKTVLNAYDKTTPQTPRDVAGATGLPLHDVGRATYFLLKYDFLREGDV